MHSVIYRTEMLKLCQLELPKHTFYVDNIYVYYPLPHVRTLYYMNVDLYRYFIGREDQSVNEKVMINWKCYCCKPLLHGKFGINNEVYKFALIKKWKQEAEKIYGELSGDHDDSFFYFMHSL